MIPTLKEVPVFLEKLGYNKGQIKEILLQIQHFELEAPQRDEIIKEYFDNECIERIIQEILKQLLTLKKNYVRLLDIGAGSGFFTSKIIKKLSIMGHKIDAFGLDVTPGMLSILEQKGITPIWGTSEKIMESIELARTNSGKNIPDKFDVIISLFNLHHLKNPSEAFKSMSRILDEEGMVIVVDIYRYDDQVLQEKMRDVHPGFTIEELIWYSKPYFKEANFRLMWKVRCKAENIETEVIIGALKLPL